MSNQSCQQASCRQVEGDYDRTIQGDGGQNVGAEPIDRDMEGREDCAPSYGAKAHAQHRDSRIAEQPPFTPKFREGQFVALTAHDHVLPVGARGNIISVPKNEKEYYLINFGDAGEYAASENEFELYE